MGVSAFWKVAATSLILVFLNLPADAQSPKTKPPDVQNPLNQKLVDASSNGNIAEMKNLIAEGADVNCCKDGGKGTPLMIAAFHAQAEAVRLLLNSGADISLQDRDGKTALHKATAQCQPEGLKAVEMLLEGGADLNDEDRNGYRPWFWSFHVPQHMYRQCKPMRQLLFKYSKRREGLKSNHSTAQSNPSSYQKAMDLILTYQVGDIEEMEMLVAAGADVNCCRTQGNGTPLMKAAFHRDVEAVRFLLSSGADANLQDRDGRTALHKVLLMCMDKKTALPVAELLLQHGADLTIKDREGKTPLDSVSLGSCPEMQQLVRKYKR